MFDPVNEPAVPIDLPGIYDTFDEARRATDAGARQEAYNKCFDIIAEEVPLYPLFHKKVLTGYWADKIEGFEPSPTTGLYFQDAKLK